MANVETWTEKITRKFKENPFVPLGAAATVATLIIASKKMRRGQSQQMNHWLRARVAAQGFTILAICGGTYWMNKQKRETALVEAIDEMDAEKLKVDKERREFEERLQEAETAHRSMTQSKGNGTDSPSKACESNSSTISVLTRQSWLEWLGWNRNSRSPLTASTSTSQSKKESPS